MLCKNASKCGYGDEDSCTLLPTSREILCPYFEFGVEDLFSEDPEEGSDSDV